MAAPRKPVLLELVGPAGAGKSTVFQALLSRREDIEALPVLSSSPYAGVLARSVLGVLVTLVRRRALRRRTREQVVMMGYLQALPRVLDGRRRGDERIVVFDQGPIFFLTRPSVLDERLSAWRDQMLDTWSSRLDAVVWLDAPGDVLADRINARSKPHALKGRPDDVARDVIAESRAGLEETIAELSGRGRAPSILRFDTSRASADDIVDEILSLVAHGFDGGSDRSPGADRS